MRWTIEKKIMVGAGLVLAILIINALVSYRATRRLIDNEQLVTHTYEVIAELEGVLDTMDDAESAERDYLLSGEESYLKSYQSAGAESHARVSRLRLMTVDDTYQPARIPDLERQIADRLRDLNSRIESRKNGRVEAS